MRKIYIKKYKLLNKRWGYSRFKCTNDNQQLNSYFSSIMKSNSYQMKRYMSKSKKIEKVPFKRVIKLHSPLYQMIKIALKTHKNMTPHGAIQKYLIENDNLTVATELPIYSTENKVGGFIDILRYKDGICEIIDFKVGSDKYGVEQQLWKYKLGLEENFNGKIICSYITDEEYVRINYE